MANHPAPRLIALALLCLLSIPAHPAAEPRRIDGYRGIWFDLGQRSQFGSKYSGGLGTYTAKHHPLAIYSPTANKTFFVYGGTTAANKRHLLAMASYYDHKTNQVPRPVVVHDKQGVDDPHDNPSLQIDGTGRLWVFVSGRGTKRPGHIYRATKPYDIASFKHLAKREFTYPQPWWIKDKGFVLLFTKYTKGRELYCSASDKAGGNWSKDKKLAAMGGHYQMSNHQTGRLITAFNMHPKGNVDQRTNLYYIQTKDRGKTWQTVTGQTLKTPITNPNSPALVRDYRSEGKLVYLKDTGFDAKGNPVLLYLTSKHHQPGPKGNPRTWTIAHWAGKAWQFHDAAQSTHNYDTGSIYIEPNNTWRIIAPTEPGPQPHGTGGKIAQWISTNQGKTWKKEGLLTPNPNTKPKTNHGYARRPVNAHPNFYTFWADGNPDQQSKSHLYFYDLKNQRVGRLPYDMDKPFATPSFRAVLHSLYRID